MRSVTRGRSVDITREPTPCKQQYTWEELLMRNQTETLFDGKTRDFSTVCHLPSGLRDADSGEPLIRGRRGRFDKFLASEPNGVIRGAGGGRVSE